MKILHINSYYSTSSFYKNLFEYQKKNGLDIDVFIPVYSNFQKKDFDYGEYTLISKNYNQHDRFIFHFKHQKIYKAIQSRYNFNEYSLIHAHSLFSNGYIALRLKKAYGIPYIVAVRNTDVNVFFNKVIYLRRLGIKILKEAKQIVFLSETYKNYVLDKYVPKSLKEIINRKISIIPNGIDDFWLNNIGLPKQAPKASDVRFLQIGDINKNKNIITTIKAISILFQKGFNVKLDVVGKLKDQDIFKKIKDLDYVNYLGFKSKEELIKIYKDNDILVMPSKHETFGLVYAEAMSQGLPIIYTRGQGFDGQFNEGEVGYSVQYDSAEEIAKRVKDILDNYETISNNCIAKVDRFDWDRIAKKYMEIYNSINKEVK